MIHNDVNLSTSPASPPSSPPTSDTPASNSFPLSENHDLLRAYEQGGGGGGVAAGIPAINISIHSPNANHVLGEYPPIPIPIPILYTTSASTHPMPTMSVQAQSLFQSCPWSESQWKVITINSPNANNHVSTIQIPTPMIHDITIRSMKVHNLGECNGIWAKIPTKLVMLSPWFNRSVPMNWWVCRTREI